MTDSTVMKGTGPFYFEGNEIGLLLLHGGGGGTAADLYPLAKDLHNKGNFTIRVPLLPGYGTTPQDLKATSKEDWFRFIKKELSYLKETCDTIILGGHSMGAILTLIFAARDNVDGIFTISAPIGLQGFIHKLVPIFKFFISYYPVDSDQFRKDTNGQWVGYDKIPLNIASKIKDLIKIMEERLSDIQTPIILFQGRLDSVIKEESMETIYQSIKSPVKRKVWLNHSDHPILNIPDHDKIVSEIFDFINDLN